MQNRSLFLKIISAVIIFGAWEIGGRSGVSFAFHHLVSQWQHFRA